MKTTCRVDSHPVSVLSLSRRDCIVSHSGRVRAHILANNRTSYTFAPHSKLLDSGSTECVGSAEHHLLSCLLILISKFADSCRFSCSIHADNHNHIRMFAFRHVEITLQIGIVLLKQRSYLITKDFIQFICRDIFIPCNTSLDTLDDTQSGVHTDIRSDKHLFKVVEHLLVYLAFTSNST